MSTFGLPARLSLVAALVAAAACGGSNRPATPPRPVVDPRNDARVGLKAGLMDAGEATENLKVVAKAVSPPGFLGITNSDLAFTGNYVIQGNYNGPVIWDISNPSKPELVTAFTCPASQNDISVYKNLMFMSAEANNGRVDCLPGGVPDTVSALRFRGVRVFDISDIKHPKIVANVQTCRGSHTHTVVESPKDPDNIYIYVSGSSGIRSPNELAGCVRDTPDQNPNSSLLRIEIIKVPLAHPEQSAVVNKANIFSGLTTTGSHGTAQEDLDAAAKAAAAARAQGGFTAKIPSSGQEIVLGSQFIRPMLDSVVKARGGSGSPTGADSAALRSGLQGLVNKMFGSAPAPGSPIAAGRQCHDITVYPSLGLAGGACEGHGLLIDINDPVNPVRLDAVADSNFAYWHSATFNNDGTKILFSDEWGGGGAPKCRATDKREWGADAIFTHREPQAEVRELLQDPHDSDGGRELRRAQRVAHPDPRARRDGAGLVPGRHLGLRLDRSCQAVRGRVLRSWPGRLHADAHGRLVVGVLVQRLDRELRDRARHGRRRPHAEPVHLAERDRCGEDGALDALERAGSAQDRLAAVVRAGALLRGPARAQQVPLGRTHRRGAVGTVRRRTRAGSTAVVGTIDARRTGGR